MQTTRLDVRDFPALERETTLPTATLRDCHETYRSHVAAVNDLFDRLARADAREANHIHSTWRSLKCDLPVALATVKSYEIMLSHLGGRGGAPGGDLAEQIRHDFGSLEAFLTDVRGTAMASRGWMAVAYDLDLRRLITLVGDTPEQLTVWNLQPVMVLDVSERTASVDFRRDRRRYVESLLQAVDWTVVARNLDDAKSLQPAGRPF